MQYNRDAAAAAVAGERVLLVKRTRGIQRIQGAHALLLCAGGRRVWHNYIFRCKPSTPDTDTRLWPSYMC